MGFGKPQFFGNRCSQQQGKAQVDGFGGVYMIRRINPELSE
jgi:hypothetical protein